MADVIRKATNKFTKGLVMDFSPENTKNEVLTHALNATLLTFNGNELSLQNDMGNARVETAFLPEGYMPVGTCEYGGIIYIVSYNPLEDKSQIGCFPSPERNVSSDELGIPDKLISSGDFQNFINGKLDGTINNTSTCVLLKNDNLNPGDKFLVCSDKAILNERLADLFVKTASDADFRPISNPMIALNVVSIEESGKIVYLNSDLRKYDVSSSYIEDESSATYRYHILGDAGQTEGKFNQAAIDIDNYRNVLSSGYNVFKSKTSGKLAILAELLTIDSYSVTHSIVPEKIIVDEKEVINEGSFDVIIHTEVSPEITTSNVDVVPKLQYYYLQNSQGYLQTANDEKTVIKTLFNVDDNGKLTKTFNDDFLRTFLSNIYTPTTDADLDLNKSLEVTSKFHFPTPFTYHGKVNATEGNGSSVSMGKTNTKFTAGKYHRIMKSQIYTTQKEFVNYWHGEVRARFYKYDTSEAQYSEAPKNTDLSSVYTYYVQIPHIEYIDAQRNEKCKNETLYMLASKPIAATEEILKNELVEKYVLQKTHFYRKATIQDIENGKTVYQESSDGKYDSVANPDVNKVDNYYVLEEYDTYVSVGYGSIDKEEYNYVYYYPTTKSYVEASEEILNNYWDFINYPTWGSPILYYQKMETTYREATEEEMLDYSNSSVTLYYRSVYKYMSPEEMENFNDSQFQLFISVPMDSYIPETKFKASTLYNYIEGNSRPPIRFSAPSEYPYDDPLSQYTVSDFIPTNLDNGSEFLQYEDIKLANIKIPKVVYTNGLDLPFKYDYTLVPCMNYGRLDHLAVSSTVDFSKLHAFNQSDFTTWKYHIDGNQLRLTFGAEIFDTYETDKVDGLVLEFYDVWGFAGSIEITDKKSYSGIFTKIIPLNSLGALSKNRIEGRTYNANFKRNININEEWVNGEKTGNFLFNGKRVIFDEDYGQGWQYLNGDKWSVEDNDCGTLYSNMVYGVKAYIRRATSNEFEFIKKKDFFLYTLPIYNDYYYTVNDFNTLKKPPLDLVLTYKMQDKSTKVEYENDIIKSGYSSDDKSMVSEYLKGFLDGVSQFDVTKYYKYTGTTDLYLEIGLKQDYQSLNLSYSPAINEYFSCTLQLIGDTIKEQSFVVNRDDAVGLLPEQMLGYEYQDNGKYIVDLSENKLVFENDSDKLQLNPGKDSVFYQSNFINNNGNNPLKINYSFIVGYPVNIFDIKTTEIKTTTACALCHQDSLGNYNYSDFGIREVVDANGASTFMSDVMYYNEGTLEQERFGLCRQINTLGTVTNQCSSITLVTTDAQVIKTVGKLNAGEPLKQVVPILGKLTFCQPHVHGFSDTNGVNMYWDASRKRIGVPEDDGGWDIDKIDRDDCWGIVPTMNLANEPRYNLVLNTKNSIVYNSEFISTTQGGEFTTTIPAVDLDNNKKRNVTVHMREFIGLTGYELTQFNKKLIQTFKDIYVYNPDYDSLAVNIGKVSVDTKKPYFTSNLISTDSNLALPENKTLNDFIYIGPILFSEYLTLLNKHSEDSDGNKIQTIYSDGKPLETVWFVPNYTYCGTPENYYLLSSLTYNIPEPTELSDELSFKADSSLVVRHENGDIEFIDGQINKKAFYGFNHVAHKLIQLDVSNYSINLDGKLTLNSTSSTAETKSFTHTISDTELMSNSGVEFTRDFISNDGVTSQAKLRAYLNVSAEEQGSPIAYGSNSVILAIQRTGYDEHNTFNYSASVSVAGSSKQNGYTYVPANTGMRLKCNGVLLDSDKVSLEPEEGKLPLRKQTYETLSSLANQNLYKDITPIYADGSIGSPTSAASYKSADVINFTINGDSVQPEIYTNTSTYGDILMNVSDDDYSPDPSDEGTQQNPYQDDIELIEITFDSISYELTRKMDLKDLSTGVIKTAQTSKYSSISGYTYTVDDKYKNACFKGTSLNINDLIYEPNVEGHRLFVKNNLCAYNDTYRGKIYYRFYTEGNKHDSWRYDSDYKYRNVLFLQTGPCFDPNNLK